MTDRPISLLTKYRDLLETHRMRPPGETTGLPVRKGQGPTAYWCDVIRVGDKFVHRYLGADCREQRTSFEIDRDTRVARDAWVERCSALVARLADGGLPRPARPEGMVLDALAKVGTFRLGGTLVGTHAFRLYAADLGVDPDPALGETEDINIAAFAKVSLVTDRRIEPSLQNTFRYLDLQPTTGLDPRQKPTRWRVPGSGSIDFLAPRTRSDHDVVPLDTLGIHASVHCYLDFLIAEPILAVALYREGVPVRIPRPERYAVHKLILSVVRNSSEIAKARKDMAQATWLTGILSEDRPGELANAVQDARSRGPKWSEALDKAIGRNEEISRMLAKL